ncbi:MAG TPA: alanine--tRNA ligase-related protein, partial [Buchnera sp. (in: enterobacteria)]|nr:alanine--tRNA ligase-related protein [Buchnera sp. (in: enterobacteria)]
VVFYLYDTFGFPIDLTIDICHEYDIEIDRAGFNKAMDNQKKQSKKITMFYQHKYLTNDIDTLSIFKGYELTKTTSTLTHIIINNKIKKNISSGEKGILLLHETPFYGESGGQIGDIGIIYNHHGKFQVQDTKKQGNIILHIGILISGILKTTDIITAEIDYNRRLSIQKNHSATHLLHAALITILGKHIVQKGSLITEHLIRFDFSHTKKITLNVLQSIECLINLQICNNLPITTNSVPFKNINKKKIISLSNKQYPSIVRILSIGNYSHELCGGTHTKRTGDIGLFKILSERGIASNIHRIEAITGKIALDKIHDQENNIKELSLILKTNTKNLKNAFQKIILNNIIIEKELSILKEKEMLQEIQSLTKKAIEIKTVKLLVATLHNKNIKSLRIMIDKLKNKLKHVIIVLANIIDKKVIIIVGITKNATQIITANDLIKMILKNLNGKGGGKSDIAEGGSIYLKKLPEILSNIKLWITEII